MPNKHSNLTELFSNLASIIKTKLNISTVTPLNFVSYINLLEKESYFQQYCNNSNFQYLNSQVTKIIQRGFYLNKNLTAINCPICTRINTMAFTGCTNLSYINFPRCSSIGDEAFAGCTSLTDITLLEGTYLYYSVFRGAENLQTVILPKCIYMYNSAFANCYNLISLYLMNSATCQLFGSNAFGSTPIGGYSTSAGRYGSIFVPASLVSAYQSATNWVYFANRIFAIEDYPPPSS